MDLSYQASLKAIEKANISLKEIDLVIVATVTSDYAFPGVAQLLQARLELNHVMAFDINAACSGFLFAMQIADKMIKSGAYQKALIVGAETLSRLTDWRDRNTCVLFGDGAGAMVIGRSDDLGIIDILAQSSGDEEMLLYCKNPSLKTLEENKTSMQDHIHMKGNDVFKFASRIMPKTIQTLLERNQLTLNDINYIVAHQANSRIIHKASKDLHVDLEKMYMNIDRYGNTSAASVPIAIDEAIEKGHIKKDDVFATVAFGGGLTWAGAIIKY